MRRAVFLVVFLIVACAAWAYVSPRLAAKRFRDAVVAGDANGLTAIVDFPALREHLKADLRAAVTQRTANPNPLRGVGVGVSPPRRQAVPRCRGRRRRQWADGDRGFPGAARAPEGRSARRRDAAHGQPQSAARRAQLGAERFVSPQ